jgi:hypothetical protein
MKCEWGDEELWGTEYMMRWDLRGDGCENEGPAGMEGSAWYGTYTPLPQLLSLSPPISANNLRVDKIDNAPIQLLALAKHIGGEAQFHFYKEKAAPGRAQVLVGLGSL